MKQRYSELKILKLAIGATLLLSLLQGCKQKPITDEELVTLMKERVSFLASDKLEGRETGTRGEKEAGRYVARAFEDTGLSPAGTAGYIQEFDVTPSMNPHEQPQTSSGSDSTTITGTNIIGLLDNPGDEIVVIGAHLDHLGYGGFGSLYRGDSAIHNGADDNASGIAVMLALARTLSAKDLNKDVLFIAFSGEEKGLWGSNYFTKHPTIDLKKVDAMINLDMVGRLNEKKTLVVHGTGTSPAWPEILHEVNKDSLDLIMKSSGVGPSDHTSFYLQDIPVLHFFTGQHEDYHKPTDDAEKLNYTGMVRIMHMVSDVVVTLNNNEPLEFTKTKDESADTPKFKVTLGVVPDYLFDGKGMRIDGVSEDRPASKAGLQKGDVVIQLGDQEVTDMMSYMKALSQFEEGDETSVRVKRDDKELTFPIKF